MGESIYSKNQTDRINTSKNRRDDWTQLFYGGRKWRKLAQKRKKYANQLCEWHYHGNPELGVKGGRIVPIEGKKGVVHHIKELRTHKELAYDWDNLVAICHECHALAHPDKVTKMTYKKSKRQQRKERIKRTNTMTIDDI